MLKRVKWTVILLAAAAFALGVFYFPASDLNDFEDDFLNAARDGDAARVAEFLDNGEDPNKRDSFGNSALTIAGYFGRSKVAELLLNRGANLQLAANSGMTPLHCAVYHGHGETAKLFLARGADPNKRDSYGMTPLAIAAANGAPEVAEILLQNGADTSVRDALGWTPLHIALRATQPLEEDRLAVVTILLDHGADPNALNPGGWEKDSEHDSHVGWRKQLPNEGNSPLAIARSNGFSAIADLLRQRGAKD